MFNQAPKPELAERCRFGALPGPDCAHGHVARAFPKGLGGSISLRQCLGHHGREATVSFNVGNLYRVIWNEQAAGCDLDDRDIYSLLLQQGVDESCLGGYGLRKQARWTGPRVQSADPLTLAAAGKADAIGKLPMDLSGHLYKMCVQAILDGPGDLAGDPFSLLPDTRPDFVDLARRCGFDRSYCRKLWLQWQELHRLGSVSGGG